MGRPNFIFILIDDMGWTDLGCYGSSFYETPNLDRLAREGMQFTDAYASCPVCSPTRASIMTGKYPATVQITNRPDRRPSRPAAPLAQARRRPHPGNQPELPPAGGVIILKVCHDAKRKIHHGPGGQTAAGAGAAL